MPTRIFALLPPEFLDGSVDPLMAALSLPERLTEPYKTLFFWLVEIFLDVARMQEKNKMGTHNLGKCKRKEKQKRKFFKRLFFFPFLAVVVAPILSPETDNILQSLAMTGQVILIVENFLNFRLEADTL